MYLLPGIELNNRYKIEDVLGHGGFGITYSALDKVLNVKVAIKEYLPRQSATRGEGQTKVSIFTGEARKHYEYGLKKFLEEAQSIAQFAHHPNIVSARDYFEANNTAYMVMEYIEGVTLKEYLEQRGGKVPFEEAKAIMMPVMDALREIHLAGLLHRDISPDNIYISTTGQVKLLDFGAARYFAGEQSKSLSVILKPGYAPEEQYRSSGKQGTWTDVYATGATIYRLISGKTPPEALDRKEEDTLEPPSRLGISIPADAEKALLKALAISGAQRFRTMGEFQEALNNGMPVPEPIATTISEPFRGRAAEFPIEPQTKKPKSKTFILISGGAVGIALIGSLLWIILSQSAAKKPRPEVAEKQTMPQAATSQKVASIPSPSSPRTATDDAKGWLEQGINYIKAKDYDKARASLKEAVRLDPKNARGHFNLGLAYFNLESYQDAIEAFKKGIRLNPGESAVYRYLGMAYGHLGQHQDAIVNLKEAVRLNSHDTASHFILGKVYVHEGNKELALAEYKILLLQDEKMAADLLALINEKGTTVETKPKRPMSRKALHREIEKRAKQILENRKAEEQR
jgi:serine/threonine protein kinase